PLLDDEIVRVRARIDLVPLEVAGLVVEIRDVVAVLANEPHPTLRVRVRVARPGLGAKRHRPLLRIELRDGRGAGCRRLGGEHAGYEHGGRGGNCTGAHGEPPDLRATSVYGNAVPQGSPGAVVSRPGGKRMPR